MKTLDKAIRNLVAISVKHTEYSTGQKWKFGMRCVLWGEYRTADDEPRCYAGYTLFLDNAELYSLKDWEESNYHNGSVMKLDEPVKLTFDFWKKYKKYDTVLVLYDDYLKYCEVAGIPTSRRKDAADA